MNNFVLQKEFSSDLVFKYIYLKKQNNIQLYSDGKKMMNKITASILLVSIHELLGQFSGFKEIT